MNNGKYVFSQVTQFLDHNEFNRHVANFNGNYKVQHFTCWNQLMCMLFGQLSNRDSLRDLVLCLKSQQSKAYHLGMGKGPSKSNLASANENRNYQIFEAFAYYLIAQARSVCSSELNLDFEGDVYAVDATVVDLCLNIFWWGKHRRNKAAIKINTVFDLITYVLVSIIKAKLELKRSQYEILQILSVSLLCKIPLTELLNDEKPDKNEDENDNQLSIFTL